MPEAANNTAAAMLREARGLLLSGWCRAAQARDLTGSAVSAWSEQARSWSLLGALLASWYGLEGEAEVAAYSSDTRSLDDAIQALEEVVGMADLEQWNNEPGRRPNEVIAAIDRAVELLAAPNSPSLR